MGGVESSLEKTQAIMEAKKKGAVSKVTRRAESSVRGAKDLGGRIVGTAKRLASESRSVMKDVSEAQFKKTMDAVEQRYKGVPKTKEGWDDLLMRGSQNDLEQAGLVRLSKRSINGKPNPDYNPQIEELIARSHDLKSVNEMGGLWSALVGTPLSAGISFGPGFAGKQVAKQLMTERVQGAMILKYPWMERWVKNAEKSGIEKSKEWQRIMKGIWPLGIPARAAIIQIFNNKDKAEKFMDTMNELGGE
jgi:hypothetical protein